MTWRTGVFHNPSGIYLETPPAGLGSSCTLRIRAPREAPIDKLYLRCAPDGEQQMIRAQPSAELDGWDCRWWEVTVELRNLRFHYRFFILTPEGGWWYTASGMTRHVPTDYNDFQLLAAQRVPSWLEHSDFYQVFPDRFADGDPSNNVRSGGHKVDGKPAVARKWGDLPNIHQGGREFYGGDLQGITQNLDHFQDTLGVNALYLNPIYFPDGSYYVLGYWDEAALLSQLRQSILKSLVARKCLQSETAEVMESWPLERSGFSAFVGTAINQPTDRARLERVLRYIFRPSLPLKHLSYRETTGQVTYSPPGGVAKIWPHASDFLADLVQHVPRAKQHQVTYAGWFANALGKLNPKKENADSPNPESPKPKWVRWRALVLRTWAVDPELCPRCRKQMKRAKALVEQHELQRLLKNLGIGRYPIRPRSPPPQEPDQGIDADSQFSDDQNQAPPGWEEWDAA